MRSANEDTTKGRTVAYLRVSTIEQRDRGLSLDAQRAKIHAYAQACDLVLVDEIVEGAESAKTLDRRPGLAKALAMLKSGQADALLVFKLDRLTRSVVDLGELLDAYFAPGKWGLFSVTEQIDTRTAAGRLVLNVLVSVAQWERETIAERTALAMQHKAAQGEFCGGQPPYGWAVGRGRLVPLQTEQPIVELARRLRNDGLSLRKIAARLQAAGYKPRGSQWYPTTVKNILRSKLAA